MEYELSDEDIHPHLRARMEQRGVSREEMQEVMAAGRQASDASPGTSRKVMGFAYGIEWEGLVYAEKEVTVTIK